MISLLISSLKDFFERNLFERLIIYIFLSHLITKIVFELALGQNSLGQSQNQQWAFYALLAFDYIFSFKKIINIKITINPISIFAFILFIMLAHGLFVGIVNHNQPFVILNDTVPILMIALNILRIQSFEETKKPIDFRFLLTSCVLIASIICFFSLFSERTAIGSAAIFFPLVLSALITIRPFPKWIFITSCILLLLTIDDINRTTLLFLIIVASGYIAINSLHYPTKTFITALSMIVVLFTAWNFLPEDSKTYQRIIGLTEIDLSQRTGSIGERQAERDAINNKLQKDGIISEWIGAGFGGLYEVQFTHTYLTDYGHAHYAWAWFNLRYGKIGYLYMVIFLSTIFYSGIRNFRQNTQLGLFVSFMCLLALIYSFTHVNSILLLSGLQFLYVRKEHLSLGSKIT